MLVIEPRNGLANRLRVIDSGIELAEKLNTQLIVDWVLNKDLNCRFDKLFEPIKGIIINDGIKISYPFNKLYNFYYWYKSLKFDISFDAIALKSRFNKEDFYTYLKKYDKIYINTCNSFSPSSRKYYYFEPKPIIMHEVNLMCNKLGSDFIGIHIRRTDSGNSTSFSPTFLFIQEIKSLLMLDTCTKFFLSTDSIEDEILLKQTFPDNVFSYPKILNRNEEKGIQDALVDILCLSKATKIYGSFYSSFSEAASYFSGTKLIVLTK